MFLRCHSHFTTTTVPLQPIRELAYRCTEKICRVIHLWRWVSDFGKFYVCHNSWSFHHTFFFCYLFMPFILFYFLCFYLTFNLFIVVLFLLIHNLRYSLWLALLRLRCKLGVSNHPLALYLDPWLTLYSLVNHISDYMLINSGSPLCQWQPTHSLKWWMLLWKHSDASTHAVSSPNAACTFEGVFYYFRQRAALCQLPLSFSPHWFIWRNSGEKKCNN